MGQEYENIESLIVDAVLRKWLFFLIELSDPFRCTADDSLASEYEATTCSICSFITAAGHAIIVEW